MKRKPRYQAAVLVAAGLSLAPLAGHASSHREAPLITHTPKLDCADFYIFNSYESGRSDYVTLIANYVPLQDAYGGPNYFTLDSNALYEIHIDNNADSVEDLTFQFKFSNNAKNIPLPIGPEGNRRMNAVPVIAVGQIGAGNTAALNVVENYTVNLIRGPRRTGAAQPVTNAKDNSPTFTKPVDNIGNKTIPDYEAYANSYMYEVNIPGCAIPGRVFVGQRKDPFVVNLGETFDLINISTSPLGPPDANRDSLYYKNVTSIILEVPKACLVSGPDKPIVGAWSTCSIPTGIAGIVLGPLQQVSRLGMPLVNEVVIGLKDKDKFNASEPKDDLANFVDYVTHPTLPAIIELLYGFAGVKAPTAFPRADLVAAFATGVAGLNANGSVSEMVRLNTSIPAKPAAQQLPLAVLAGDTAGFPNGRRPGDDVVDIALRVAMGVLLPEKDAPSGKLPFTDGAYIDAKMFLDKFPYINGPLRGSPNDYSINVTVQSTPSLSSPFQDTRATYDAASGKISTSKASDQTGFYRLKADGKVSLDGISVQDNSVRLGVK